MELKSISLFLLISIFVLFYESKSEQESKIADRSYVYSGCSEVTENLQPSGVYEIKLPNSLSSQIKAACDTKTWGGHWTIILQRLDGSVNFYRDWERYNQGFGDLDGEFFWGLTNIYSLTAQRSYELLVLLEDSEGKHAYESYEKFAISSSSEYYALNILGKANGTAGDSLSIHRNYKFSTYDRNNNPKNSANCAAKFTGAWWYGNPCHHSNLNGVYNDKTCGKGINWKSFRGYANSLKRAVMMIRPRK